MRYFRKLIGDRIYLSPRNSEDVEFFTKWLNDFQTTDYIARSGLLTSLQSEKEYLEKPEDSSKYYFSIVTLEKDELIGTISLEGIDYIHRIATLGIFIGNTEYRSKGIGQEAIRLILDYGFNYLNLNNIKLDVLSCNPRAIACYKKCGFKEYGRRREACYLNGKYYDRISMDILKKEFKESYIKNKEV